MQDVLAELLKVWRSGETAGLATVVSTFASAPRPPGALMVVAPDGAVSGSISGGCVEAAVYTLAAEAAQSGATSLHRFGIDDNDAFAAGLTCGGTIDVFVEPMARSLFPELELVSNLIEQQEPVAVATVTDHADPNKVGSKSVVTQTAAVGGFESDPLANRVSDDARALLEAGRSQLVCYEVGECHPGQTMTVFVASHQPRPRMLVFGAIDFAAAVAEQGMFLGYRVTVCDARPIFATAARFPKVDEVVVDWPHRYLQAQHMEGKLDSRAVVCVLTHDVKFDIPLLALALRLPQLAYVGAMGSRRTHRQRIEKLRAAGLSSHQLDRLASPIGLDLGSRTPEETAVSIAAEILSRRYGGNTRPLAEITGPIHHD